MVNVSFVRQGGRSISIRPAVLWVRARGPLALGRGCAFPTFRAGGGKTLGTKNPKEDFLQDS